jgi:branched-chain amino acid transport system permease protein
MGSIRGSIIGAFFIEFANTLVNLVRGVVKNFRWSVIPIPGRLMAVIFFVLLFTIGLITQHPYYIRMFTYVCIYCIFAVSWDLLSGYSGQLNFGHALFFGVAAYSSALLYKYLDWQPWATIPIGAVVGAVVGVVTCFPALRLRGPYLALLTLAFPLMLLGILMSLRQTGFENGIKNLPEIASTRVGEYYICLLLMTASVLIMWKLTDAGSRYVRTGLIFHAIREDEIAARATGINTIRYRLLAFGIGGFFAGLAGALYVHVAGKAGPSTLMLTTSFQAIMWVIFGGIVSIYGGVVGVFTLFPLAYLAPDIQNLIESIAAAIGPSHATLVKILEGIENVAGEPTLILSVLVILILLFMPEGIAVWIRDKIERECPRCKLSNVAWRKECRACGASLR